MPELQLVISNKCMAGFHPNCLWQPADSPLGLGMEANYVKKRDYDQRLGFQDYDIVTGHASAYYNFNETTLPKSMRAVTSPGTMAQHFA